MQPLDAKVILQSWYEAHYGFFDHKDPEKNRRYPFALVTMHEQEENTTTSSLYEVMEQYVSSEIYQNFGLSLTDFLALPREMVIKILSLASKKSAEKNTILNDIQNGLGRTEKNK